MNFRSLLPEDNGSESIFVFVRSYFLAFLPWLGLGLLLLILGVIFILIVMASFSNLLAIPLNFDIFVVMSSAYFLFLIPFLTVAFIDFYYDIHIVTDKRLIDVDQNNLFSREVNELALEEVQDVTTSNVGILSSIFDYGDVVIETAGSKQKFKFNKVLHPREIASIILDLSDQAKKRIEGGTNTALIPRSETKGVIGDRMFNSIDDLSSLGLIGTDNGAKPTSVSPSADLSIVIDDPGTKPPK